MDQNLWREKFIIKHFIFYKTNYNLVKKIQKIWLSIKRISLTSSEYRNLINIVAPMKSKQHKTF